MVLPALVIAATKAPAQAGVRVQGVVFDSVRGRPLGGAIVSVAGDPRTVIADSVGRFAIDGVSAGEHTFVAQHDSLDRIGLSGLTKRVSVSGSEGDVVIAVPSFESLWRLSCGDRPAPRDSAIIYGSVMQPDGRAPAAGATVDAAWIDLRIGALMTIAQKRWRSSATADVRGSYALCGVPMGSSVRLMASTDSAATGLIDVPLTDLRIERHDLVLGATTGTTASQHGVVAGTLTAENGAPFADARVTVGGAPEVRTDGRGRYVLRGVPVGTRQLEILALGMKPILAVVTVSPEDTTVFSAVLHKVTLLAAVNVTANARQREMLRGIEERRKGGFGYVHDSTTLAGVGTVAAVFSGFPSVHVNRTRGSRFTLLLPSSVGGLCTANVFLDGIYQNDFDQLNFLIPDDIAVVEVYPRGTSVPMDLQPPRVSSCGAVAVWTKQAMH